MDREDFHSANSPFVEDLYQAWREDSSSVSADWQELFASLDGAGGAPVRRPERPASVPVGREPAGAAASAPTGDEGKQSRVNSLLWAYRDVGYLYADLNPLQGYITPALRYMKITVEGAYERLSLGEFGLSEDDLDTEFTVRGNMRPARGPLRDILAAARQTYCSYIGVEILHIQNKPFRRWLVEKIEEGNNQPRLADELKRNILGDLIRTEELEHFIHSHFIGQKRFSIEGGEVLIPALHHMVNTAAASGVQEIVLGMAHRGRLDVLAQILGKPVQDIFFHFGDNYKPHEYGGSGDVKYHLGYSVDHRHEDGSGLHISLVPNPSHLESVDPVVQGKTRGVQDRRGDVNRKKVLPILIHGDAAFTGQGVVAETFNMSQTRGYRTGGTIHIIVNNQIGFTTASRDARSTFFPTDMAKIMPVPIFHVNGDQPEHVIRAIELAFRFRQKFGYDAVVDIICYRQYGHNEADEPSFTHPIMYGAIKDRPSVATLYGKTLEASGVMDADGQERVRREYRDGLQAALDAAAEGPSGDILNDAFQIGDWKDFKAGYSGEAMETGVARETLDSVARGLTTIPEGFSIHRKLKRIVDDRRKRLEAGEGIDWATAEALAFGTLLLEGTPIRLSGEDSGRGTFSQRHSVWWDTSAEAPKSHTPLNHLSQDQAAFSVYDSPLSEFSILGFEYGYALIQPRTLTLWEAQFGDFCNGAQVIIDNYVASGETKWFRSNGLVMLLPHGYEGQGPEHSSAHLERFMQLCAEENIQVCNPTTPAQYFHLLRRQMLRPFRKPLVVMTPKSLLRHSRAVSRMDEMAGGGFHEVLGDPSPPADPDVRVALLCSGKIFYDLFQRREKTGRSDQTIVRLEQLYPFPHAAVGAAVGRFDRLEEVIWVQEEPENRGAWRTVRPWLEAAVEGKGLKKGLRYVGRKASASPATGSHSEHAAELESIVTEAVGETEDETA